MALTRPSVRANATASDLPATGGPQRLRAGAQRAAGRDDVVHQHGPARRRLRPHAHAAGRPGAALAGGRGRPGWPRARRARGSRSSASPVRLESAAASSRAWLNPRRRRRRGCSGTGTSAAAFPDSPGGAFAAICAAIASASATAPRNLSARTSARAGPSYPTGAQALTAAEPHGCARQAPQQPRGSRGRAAPAGGRARRRPSREGERARHRSFAAMPCYAWAPHCDNPATSGSPPAALAARPRRAGAAGAVRGHLHMALQGGAPRGRRPRRGRQGGASPSPAPAIAILIALVSPLDGLGEDYLFSAHMLQHVLLGDIAPLLLLLALSRVIMRPATRRLMRVERALGPLANPVTGLVLWLALMYLWHVPALYDAAVQSAPLPRPRAPLLLRGRHRALVGADPAGADAPAHDRDAARRLHRRREGRPRGARPVSGLGVDAVLSRTTRRCRGSGA